MIKKLLIGVVLVAAGAFGWWTISPLFIDVEVNDELPVNISEESSVTVGSEATILPSTPATTSTATGSVAQIETAPPPPAPPAPRIFPIQDTFGHPATGNIRIVETPEEKIVRYEDYDGTNGPDLRIYLADDLEATNFVSLGPARANRGNINYSVPLDIDLSEYNYVLTWCEAFGVLFDYAEIN